MYCALRCRARITAVAKFTPSSDRVLPSLPGLTMAIGRGRPSERRGPKRRRFGEKRPSNKDNSDRIQIAGDTQQRAFRPPWPKWRRGELLRKAGLRRRPDCAAESQ